MCGFSVSMHGENCKYQEFAEGVFNAVIAWWNLRAIAWLGEMILKNRVGLRNTARSLYVQRAKLFSR